MKLISTGSNKFISVFPRETKSVGLIFTKECSFVLQKDSLTQRKDVICLRTDMASKLTKNLFSSHVEELFYLG